MYEGNCKKQFNFCKHYNSTSLQASARLNVTLLHMIFRKFFHHNKIQSINLRVYPVLHGQHRISPSINHRLLKQHQMYSFDRLIGHNDILCIVVVVVVAVNI